MARSLRRPIAFAQLSTDLLEFDQVMTTGQIERYYGLKVAEVERVLPHRDVLWSPLNTSSVRVPTVFVTSRKHVDILRWRPTWELAHLAGTAELRHRLGVQRGEGSWTLEGGYGENRPDAEWVTLEGQRFAVEYDAGYPPAVVREKLHAFEKYDGVYWGTPSRVRRANLQSRYPGQAQFLTLDLVSPIPGPSAEVHK